MRGWVAVTLPAPAGLVASAGGAGSRVNCTRRSTVFFFLSIYSEQDDSCHIAKATRIINLYYILNAQKRGRDMQYNVCEQTLNLSLSADPGGCEDVASQAQIPGPPQALQEKCELRIASSAL